MPCIWSFTLVFLGCTALAHAAAGAPGRIVPAEVSNQYQASVVVAKECPGMRIAVINGVSFHFEVLAGILHVLRPYEKYIDVYMSPWIKKENYDGETASARATATVIVFSLPQPEICRIHTWNRRGL